MGAATRKLFAHVEVDNGEGHYLMFLTIATKISVNIFTRGILGARKVLRTKQTASASGVQVAVPMHSRVMSV